MKELILLTLIGFTFKGCFSVETQANQFILRGDTPGLANGTVLHLMDAENGQPLDSATVVNQKFEISGKIDDPPFRTYIICNSLQESRMTWLEPGLMTIKIDSTLLDAEMVGSETDEISFELFKKIRASKSDVESMEIVQNFIRTNPQNIVSASLLAGYSRIWGKKFSKSLFDGLSKEMRQTKYGERIGRYLEVNNQPNLGEKYVNIKMKDPAGLERELSDLKGKVVLLEFWASWCKPCRDQNPQLLDIYNRNRGNAFEIFAVSLDSDATQWVKAIDTDELPWIHVSDLKGNENEAALIYGIGGIPDNFLIDQNGILVGRDLRGEALSSKLEEFLSD